MIGLTHAIAGSFMAESWGLSNRLQHLIRGSCLPEIDNRFKEMALVYLAGQIARVMFGYDDGEVAVDEIDPAICELLGLKEKTILCLCHDDSFYAFAEKNIERKPVVDHLEAGRQ